MDNKYQDFGLLLMRVGLGLTFIIYHGGPKLIGGPDRWEEIGQTAGLDFLPHLWGFMAAFSESVGALFVMIGFFTRYALILLIITMVMATTFHFRAGDGQEAHALKMGIAFLGLFFIGAGRYSLDARFREKQAA